MRIWLAYKSHLAGASDPFTSLLPVGLCTINAVLRHTGYASRLANLSGFDDSQIVSMLKEERPALVGLSMFTHNRRETCDLVRLVKGILPDCFVVLGGPHATHRWQELLVASPLTDAIVIGEGEATMLELAGAVEKGGLNIPSIKGIAVRAGGEVSSPVKRQPLADLDGIPFAGMYVDDAIGVDPRSQLEFLISSRGCPASCRFCSSPGFWGRTLRFRSPSSLVEEIRYLRDRFGLIYFSIRDDTFTADRQRVLEFCQRLLDERIFILWNCQSRVNAVDSEMLRLMKKSGCECLQLGVESGSLRVLKSLGKSITPKQVKNAAEAVHEAGIRLSIYLIAGSPGEDDSDILESLNIIASARPDDGQVSPLVYYPGTELFDSAVRTGAVPADLFESDEGVLLPVRRDRFVARATGRLMTALRKSSERNSLDLRGIARQKERLGYCHATNLLAGDLYAGEGKPVLAEREYREIIRREPDNPWGWLALGELLGESGRLDEAVKAFTRLCTLVPAHLPAYIALGEVSSALGNIREAEGYFRQAESMRH